MLNVTFGQASDPGKLRNVNEDAMGSFLPRSSEQARTHGWLFVVADGVGGLDLGEVAAAKAVSVIAQDFSLASPATSLLTLLPGLIQTANAAVRAEGLQPERQGKRMATTVVSCALRYDEAVISHVGDSRCYLVRNRVATAVTEDDTLVNEQRKLGIISSAEAAQSEVRGLLAQALGMEPLVSANTKSLSLKPGDILVLCSDGLSSGICEADIARIVTQKKDMQQIAEELVRYAVDVDGSDNTTAQVISIGSVESRAMYRGRPY